MGLLKEVILCILWVCRLIYSKIPHASGTIPQPGICLHVLLYLAFGNEKLLKLEFLTDFYEPRGLFRYDNIIYIFNTKLAQSAINKLDKGAEDYLKNSPLKETFLGTSSKSPEVRRAIAALFRKSTLEEKGHLIVKDVMNMCDKIGQEANEGKLINITDWSLRMAMDVVGHVLLQLDLCALEGNQEKLLDCLMTILHRCYALAVVSPDSAEFRNSNEQFERLTSEILENALSIDDVKEDDRLVKKLHEACGFDQARDNMKLFLMAGSETTASSIPVLLYLLTVHTDVQEELRQEADENIDKLLKNPALQLPKIEAVLKELLRVYPIAPFISRRTYQPVTIGNCQLPSNSDIRVFTWGIHRSSAQWTFPKDFKPFRFLNNSDSLERNSMYIPFGSGARICIGQHLAWLELKIATAILLHRFSFSKTSKTPNLNFVVDWAHAVIHPDVDMFFKASPRI